MRNYFVLPQGYFFFIQTPCEVRNLTRNLLHRKLSSLSRMSQICLRESGYLRHPLKILCVRTYHACHDPRLKSDSLKFLSELTWLSTYFNEVRGDLVCKNTYHGYGGNQDVLGYKKVTKELDQILLNSSQDNLGISVFQ